MLPQSIKDPTKITTAEIRTLVFSLHKYASNQNLVNAQLKFRIL